MYLKFFITASLIFFIISVSIFLELPQKVITIAQNTDWSIEVFAQKDTSKLTRSSGVISRVIDGDTAELSTGERVRYLNIDTPESVKPDTPIMCYGKEASHFNKSLVEGKKVTFVFDKEKKDKYGRLLPFIFLEGADTLFIENSVNAKLVQEGYARSYIIKPNTTFEREFVRFQQQAQERHAGLWANCPNPFKE
jgi:micrococcal nuclease